jgi:hypothetical protein
LIKLFIYFKSLDCFFNWTRKYLFN